MQWRRNKCLRKSRLDFLPGVVIEVVAGTDYKERRCVAAAVVAVVVVQDFVEGAHEEIGLGVGPGLNVDQD